MKTVIGAPEPCPNCGRCPHCGNVPGIQLPKWPGWPNPYIGDWPPSYSPTITYTVHSGNYC